VSIFERVPKMIELRQVGKVFAGPAGGTTALCDVTLDFEPGRFVTLVGQSGSGKSTLLNLVAGIDRPTAGEVVVAGTSVHRLGESALAAWRGRHVGVVFQFFQLLPTLTVQENVMLPMDLCGTRRGADARRHAQALLESMGIADQAAKLPAELSGGQQQRAAIARALANDPPLLVADEPTGNLDSHTARLVVDLLVTLARRGKTVLMVTHERDVGARADRVVTMADGRVVADTRSPAAAAPAVPAGPAAPALRPAASAAVAHPHAGLR
jgi:putative ABC transport system ATP-binding protein